MYGDGKMERDRRTTQGLVIIGDVTNVRGQCSLKGAVSHLIFMTYSQGRSSIGDWLYSPLCTDPEADDSIHCIAAGAHTVDAAFTQINECTETCASCSVHQCQPPVKQLIDHLPERRKMWDNPFKDNICRNLNDYYSFRQSCIMELRKFSLLSLSIPHIFKDLCLLTFSNSLHGLLPVDRNDGHSTDFRNSCQSPILKKAEHLCVHNIAKTDFNLSEVNNEGSC